VAVVREARWRVLEVEAGEASSAESWVTVCEGDMCATGVRVW